MAAEDVALSKQLAYLLRHNPAAAGLMLDEAGWVDLDDLLAGLSQNGSNVTPADIEQLVARSSKRRFELVDGRIRAAQGHSVDVDLAYEPAAPPTVLFHGTVERFLTSILEQGLVRGDRTHVHLSEDRDTAIAVGSRRGKPIILSIEAARMHSDGLTFHVASNGVWLTDHVPAGYLTR